jgi:hypothetical protein
VLKDEGEIEFDAPHPQQAPPEKDPIPVEPLGEAAEEPEPETTLEGHETAVGEPPATGPEQQEERNDAA